METVVYCMLFFCLARASRKCSVTARVLLKSMIKQALFEEKIEIEIRDDFDFEAVKTLDAA